MSKIYIRLAGSQKTKSGGLISSGKLTELFYQNDFDLVIYKFTSDNLKYSFKQRLRLCASSISLFFLTEFNVILILSFIYLTYVVVYE